ncbi:MAG TPA: hypothetical protein VGJ13_13930 [Pseudonocardiaceae bacterium]
MQLHSEQESYRATIALRTPEEERTTVIVMRREREVWVTLNGAIRTTVTMNEAEAHEVVEAITAAQGASHSPG